MPGDAIDGRRIVTAGDVIIVRDKRVMLDARVAAAFGTPTKRVHEAVLRNAAKFDTRHVFRLSVEEARALRSQRSRPARGRGGARYRPHVFTLKGIARLATVLDSPAALAACDLIIDTFTLVQIPVRRSRRTIATTDPTRQATRSTPRDVQPGRLRSRLRAAVGRLVDALTSPETGEALIAATAGIGADAIASVRARLRARGVANAKLEADAALVLAEAERMLAEARRVRAEADLLDIEHVEKQVRTVREVVALIGNLQRSPAIEPMADLSVSASGSGSAARQVGKRVACVDQS
ncbi:MAG: ORF6N domain-containing protein [Hyphomicrobiaceae bacterium]